MSHLQITRNYFTKRHSSLFLTMWIMWFQMFCSKHQVRFPSSYKQTCCNSCEKCL